MITFTPRSSVPAKDNKYYIRKAYGGYSPCIVGKPRYDGERSALANCVGYAWGRVAEICNNPLIKIGYPSMSAGWPANAQNWYSTAANVGFLTGMTPKLGAVACWRNKSNTSGHVAVVEQILDTGGIVVSESAYKGYFWRVSTLGKSYYKKGLIFQGFIYLNEDIEPAQDDELRVGDKVQIVGKGNAQANGKGMGAAGIGLTRYIYRIYKGYAYPYRVGYMNGQTIGFYQKGALKKL